jgi:prepilin-type N-terminal cleavage/methylation domain-containing protein
MNPQRVTPRGFTLIELLTVIAIIGILASIIIPVVGKVRLSAQTAKSVSNLRQLQLANISHAADNKGKFIKPYNENSGNQYDFSNGWPANQILATYTGAIKGGWTVGEQLPLAKSGFPSTSANTIGYNHTDYNKLPSRWRSLTTNEIVNPGKHIAFAEASDWIIAYSNRRSWNAATDTGSGALAYRAGDTTIVVTYGGNVQKLTKTEADDKARWIIDPTKI